MYNFKLNALETLVLVEALGYLMNDVNAKGASRIEAYNLQNKIIKTTKEQATNGEMWKNLLECLEEGGDKNGTEE